MLSKYIFYFGVVWEIVCKSLFPLFLFLEQYSKNSCLEIRPSLSSSISEKILLAAYYTFSIDLFYWASKVSISYSSLKLQKPLPSMSNFAKILSTNRWIEFWSADFTLLLLYYFLSRITPKRNSTSQKLIEDTTYGPNIWVLSLEASP